ncbi:sugar ABC transporter ATP-binding protein [Blastopirellula marina]|uniref:Putative ATP-binding protein of ribose ABC transport system n=1 Tax=Blastopirellula marina DSM 3645 TaxID=314230 RepID=A4A054_9BACT|nr:sugar ABC transporter ATP-binding protein [Blastopirellula marina]EAQ77840.1 putative ATP-binding protein of ribose ABC transport system [Blastopirellula marina DSM 3645]
MPLLEVCHVSKRFPGVQALQDVSLSIAPGQSIAVIGENGAGKSTLMKILAGIQTPDEGEIRIDGRAVEIRTVRDAEKQGIALIHQELNLCDNLDVAANIFLGKEPRSCGFLRRREMDRRAAEVLQQVGLDIQPTTSLASLSIGRRQLVEIAKALASDAQVLIMDEPTSSLSTGEVENLFRVIHTLRQRGVSIVYISHRLSEIHHVADRVVALRDGRNSGELERDEITHEQMVRLMVGRDLDQFFPHVPHSAGEVVLSAQGVRVRGKAAFPLDLELKAGEIVGLAGLVGAGRTELLETLFGVRRSAGGSVEVAGKRIRLRSPRDAIAAGLFLIPEDRKQDGLVIEMTVGENITLPGLMRASTAGILPTRWEKSTADAMIQKLRIKTPGPGQIIQFLSGGNQQKAVIAKWLAMGPQVLLLDEPTRGIDIGAKHEIYEMMETLAHQGVAILFASSEMEEVIGMSDRTLVMHEGRIAGQLERGQLSEQAIMRLATGAASAATT